MAKTEENANLNPEEAAAKNESEPKVIPVGGDDDSEDEKSETPEEDLDPVEALEAKVRDLEDQKLRAMAELDNYRKRMTRRFDDVVRSANDRLLGEVLEVVDNFERALAHTRENGTSGDKAAAALKEGTELIYQQITTLLERYGVRPIEAVGQPFDPNYHEALVQVASDEYDEGIVANEISKGYMIDDRVLRHARVAVSRGSENEEADGAAEG